MSGKGSDRQYRVGKKARDFGVRIAILPLLTSDKLFGVPGPQLFPLLNSGTHLAQSGESSLQYSCTVLSLHPVPVRPFFVNFHII